MLKIIKIALFSFMFIFLIGSFNVSASTFSTVHYIIDKMSVEANEEFTLSVILEDYQELIGVQFVCNIDESVFVPITKDNQYFQKPSLSIFEKDEIYENSYTTNKGLRFSGLTKNGKTYGYSNANMVFSVSFVSKIKIDDISKYFSSNIESDGVGSRIVLIDKWLREIEYQVNYCESLKASWNQNKYIVDVFGVLPNIKSDIKVLNRENGKYDIEIVSSEIDLNKIGTQVLKVKIYDHLTTEIVYLARSIEVVDRVAPIVTSIHNVFYLDDILIGSETFEFFTVNDNYEKNLEKHYRYYTESLEELANLDEFNEYLKTNQVGNVGCYSVDSSGNISDELVVCVNVLDTIKPDINEIKDFSINDVELDSFNLESMFVIKDNYDLEPKIIINNKTSSLSIIDTLKTKYFVEIEYYGCDFTGNETKHYSFTISLIDTIAPSLDNVLDISIPDEDMNKYLEDITLLEKDFIISDNFTIELKMNRKYFIDNIEVSVDEFVSSLLLGKTGVVNYQVVDSFNNKSEVKTQNVIIVDDTSPTITVNNIQNNQKYLKIDSIDYQVVDNLNLDIDVTITLNGQEYNGEAITEIGSYELVIVAVDGFNNESIQTLNFMIVEENIFGCVDGMNCGENNYGVGIIIGASLIVIIGIIVVIEIFVVKRKKEED